MEGNNLTGWNFSGQNLTNANFYFATLTNANLTGAAVAGATFGSTNLTASQLYSTTSYQAHSLQGIDLDSNNLTGWNFSGQNLTNANLSSTTLTNANLTNANLTNAYLFYATLMNANLTNANLTNAWFYSATLTSANLTGADLRGAQGIVLGSGDTTTNTVLADGTIDGLCLDSNNPTLLVRNYSGNMPIQVLQGMSMNPEASLVLEFDGNPWGSTISFDWESPSHSAATWCWTSLRESIRRVWWAKPTSCLIGRESALRVNSRAFPAICLPVIRGIRRNSTARAMCR